jgi:hypothetical protein
VEFVLKEEFLELYCASGEGISRELFDETQVALPCACGEIGCSGWAAVSNNPLSIRAHMKLYAPKESTREP